MEIWQEGKIKDFADVKGGKRLPKGKQLITEPNAHPYIRIRDLGKSKVIELTSDYEYVDDETQASISRYIVDEGDILISVVGTIGLIAIVGETLHKANQTENCDKITNLKGMDRDYLYYYLVSSFGQDEIKKGTVGAVQPKLPLKNVQGITIKYPSIEAQRKIAELLSSLDRKIETNNQINRNLSEQALAIFEQYYAEAKNKESFSSRIKVLGGGTPKTGNDSYWNGDIPFFTPKDVGTPYTFTTEKTITEDGLNNCNSKLYPINTTFVTARGTVGKVALAGVPMAMNQSCYALASDDMPELMVYFYTLEAVKALKHKASGAVFDAIVTRDFDTEIINSLSTEQENNLIETVTPMYMQIHKLTVENQRLTAIRDNLLPKLMSGEIEVSKIAV